MNRTRKARLTAGILLAAGVVVAPLAAASAAAASGPSANTPTQVPSGIDAATLPGTTVFGNTPPDTQETVSFVLRMQHMQSLAAQVDGGLPGNGFLSVSRFAVDYGQPASNINALTNYLTGYGIQTSVYPDNLDVVATGTAGEFDKALSLTEENVHVPQQAGAGGSGPVRAQDVYTNKQPPLLPHWLASFVTAILGLSNYSPFVSDVAKPSAQDQPQQGNSNSCLAKFGMSNGCHVPSFFAGQYGLKPLYATTTGAGQTMGVIALAAVDPGAPRYFWSNIAHVTRTGSLAFDTVDGGPGAPSADAGSGETDLDLEQSGAVAPGANLIAYQAPNTDYGYEDALLTAASQNVVSSVATSWGESETFLIAAILNGQESAGYVQAYDEAFLELAAQGQSVFTSSGDSGAYSADGDIGTTNLSAEWPSDSPFITATGGTTLPGQSVESGPDGTVTVTQTTQRIWSWDYLWPAIAKVTGVSLAQAAESNVAGDGGGGGFSVLESEPSYQRDVSGTNDFHAVQYLTPTDYTQIAPGLTEPKAWNFTPAPSVTSGSGYGRAAPDLSADADPQTGYLVYGTSAGGLAEWGGTSFVAQQMNGANAVIVADLGHRVGLWNPLIYRAAARGGGALTQINTSGTSSDNFYYTGNPGQVYNEGIGLGQPDLARLASVFGG